MTHLSKSMPSLAAQLRATHQANRQPSQANVATAGASALENRETIQALITASPKTCRQIENITGLSGQRALNHLLWLEKQGKAKRLSTRPVQWAPANNHHQ